MWSGRKVWTLKSYTKVAVRARLLVGLGAHCAVRRGSTWELVRMLVLKARPRFTKSKSVFLKFFYKISSKCLCTLNLKTTGLGADVPAQRVIKAKGVKKYHRDIAGLKLPRAKRRCMGHIKSPRELYIVSGHWSFKNGPSV